MSSFALAVRQNLILLIGVVGKSGTGKTKSALLVARGLVGPKGKIFAIDSENRRMSYHADDPTIGGFQAADLQPPYSPERYLALLKEAFAAKADAVVIDSLSHEWNGDGGCLAMVEQFLDEKAGNDWGKRDKFKMPAWGKVTPKHDTLVAAICRSPIPIICCFRAKDKIVMEKVEDQPSGEGQQQRRGPRTTIHTDDDAPVQRKDLVHEMTMIFQMEQRDGVGGFFSVRKRTTEGLYQAVMGVKNEQLSVEHGAALAAWCKAPNTPTSKPQPTSSATVSEIDALKKELWELSRPVRGAARDASGLNQYLWDEGILSDTEAVPELTPARFREVIEAVKKKLQSRGGNLL